MEERGRMAKQSKNKPVELILGPLPVDAINAALDMELDVGEVVFSVAAQVHARRRHPDDFARCLPHVGGVVTGPLYVGDDFRNVGKIELVSRLPVQGGGLLVAVALERDTAGRYNVASVYPVDQSKIDRRRRAGTLRNVIWRK